MQIHPLQPADLTPYIDRLLTLALPKITALNRDWKPSAGTTSGATSGATSGGGGAPVFTVAGRYTARGWTDWTQGFQFGSAILLFDATNDRKLLDLGRQSTLAHMAGHVTHMGVHDHGFNNVSTYGNLRRLMLEGRIKHNDWELAFYELALKASGAVQAARWSGVRVDQPSPHAANSAALGYVYSFNGPHSLFVDTMRTLRVMALAWKLGQTLMHENDMRANLLKRVVLHGLATSSYLIFHGDSSHSYDTPGRTAHEAIFNRNDGRFRCRSTQQGYSPFSTWSRGLAWAMLGFAEQLEFFAAIPPSAFKAACGLAQRDVVKVFEQCATQTADHYLHAVAAADGIPYWDDSAPGLANLPGWRGRPADPFNDHEPVDSSSAAVAAQALIRLGRYLSPRLSSSATATPSRALQGRLKPPSLQPTSSSRSPGKHYLQAGLTVARTLLQEPYLSTSPRHQGLLLHSIYHRPNGWDYIPPRSRIPRGESSLWGDYHLLELALLINRLANNHPYPTFFASTPA